MYIITSYLHQTMKILEDPDFKERKHYFEELDEIEFKMRFRLNKEKQS